MFRLSCFGINNNGIIGRSKKKLESKLIGNMQVDILEIDPKL